MPEISIQKRHGAYLPHWEKKDAIYSVTFRLADSVPKSKQQEWMMERADIIGTAKAQRRALTTDERALLRTFYADTIDRFLRSGHGACHMKRDDVASVIANSLQFFDGERYHLYAWCVMPNHVHVIVRPLKEHTLSSILHSWKSFSAKKANEVLDRTGMLWQPEYYDHFIRSRGELLQAMEYIWDNPEKAGLKNWPWRWQHENVFRDLSMNSDVEKRIAVAVSTHGYDSRDPTSVTDVLHP